MSDEAKIAIAASMRSMAGLLWPYDSGSMPLRLWPAINVPSVAEFMAIADDFWASSHTRTYIAGEDIGNPGTGEGGWAFLGEDGKAYNVPHKD